MDFSALGEYIVPVIAGICLIVGEIIKGFGIRDNWLRLVLAVLGVALAFWQLGTWSPSVILCGLCSSWASSGIYDTLSSNFKKGE